MSEYDTVAAFAEDEFIEKRSRFICAVTPVKTPVEAANFIKFQKEQHRDARHTVWAYLLHESDAMRYSDDGEPQGTGGQPVLEVIKRAGLRNVCVAITRYFGGILLGAGGLTRAYSNGAGLAIAAAKKVTMTTGVLFEITTDYSQYQRMNQLMLSYDIKLLDSSFERAVSMNLLIKEGQYEAFCKELTEATAATVQAIEKERRFAAFD